MIPFDYNLSPEQYKQAVADSLRAADAYEVGDFIINKYRSRAKKTDYQTVAKALRKQGVPLEMALKILLGV